MPSRPCETVVVVIGRNEGDRLRCCLRSLAGQAAALVYVDSGSGDGSPQAAAAAGCSVVELDPARPFSAARARNEGFARAIELAPAVRFVQFLDGDCSLVPGWLEQGIAALDADPQAAIVCGAVRELHPEVSVYNRLCDLEWRREPGQIASAGGRFLIRARVFRAVDGFRSDVIAAEDDEFCIRVRQAGWRVLASAAPMALHDAAMTRFGQWFRRSRRMGHAYAQVAALHGSGSERYFVLDRRKILFWGLLLPLLALVLAPFTRGLSLAGLLVAYALQFLRILGHGRARGWQLGDSALYSFFTVIGRLPAILGLLDYHFARALGREPRIIEYKCPHS
ncbi:MAG: glycosyltransferase [Terracidiphilus sp.]